MSFDTSWDILKYKYDCDLNHHWELKKKFILAHKNEFPENRLVCLAQILCNIHFLGCTYDDEMMEMVEKLAEGVMAKDQPWDKAKHQAGFASASGAIADKVKAMRGPREQHSAPQRQYTPQDRHNNQPERNNWQGNQQRNYQPRSNQQYNQQHGYQRNDRQGHNRNSNNHDDRRQRWN